MCAGKAGKPRKAREMTRVSNRPFSDYLKEDKSQFVHEEKKLAIHFSSSSFVIRFNFLNQINHPHSVLIYSYQFDAYLP